MSILRFTMTFPKGKRKAFTLSYDDGTIVHNPTSTDVYARRIFSDDFFAIPAGSTLNFR